MYLGNTPFTQSTPKWHSEILGKFERQSSNTSRLICYVRLIWNRSGELGKLITNSIQKYDRLVLGNERKPWEEKEEDCVAFVSGGLTLLLPDQFIVLHTVRKKALLTSCDGVRSPPFSSVCRATRDPGLEEVDLLSNGSWEAGLIYSEDEERLIKRITVPMEFSVAAQSAHGIKPNEELGGDLIPDLLL